MTAALAQQCDASVSNHHEAPARRADPHGGLTTGDGACKLTPGS